MVLREALWNRLDLAIQTRFTRRGDYGTICMSVADMQRLYNERREHMIGRDHLEKAMSQVAKEPKKQDPDAAFAFWFSDPSKLPDVCFDGLSSAAKVFKVTLLCYDADLAVPAGVEKVDAGHFLSKEDFDAFRSQSEVWFCSRCWHSCNKGVR